MSGSLSDIAFSNAIPAGAREHAPVLLLDRAEPFRPMAVGVSEYAVKTKSVSSKFEIVPKGERCLEYAIFWDYDIGHLYDLEHVWVHLDGGKVVAVEATQHGERIPVDLQCRGNGKPLLWCEAGKHAHFSNRMQRDSRVEATRCLAMAQAGEGGVHRGNPFVDELKPLTALHHRLARLHLKRLAFEPVFGRGQPFDIADAVTVCWHELAAWIPKRLEALLSDLVEHEPHFPAVFLDCGDTLADERSEVKRTDGSDVVLSADLITGAAEMLITLRERGYRLCLVADGPRETFENILRPRGLWDHFEAHVISGDTGFKKPDARMFATAMQVMGLAPETSSRVPMIGNNLDRDIAGANAAGHPSFFFKWSDLRRREPDGDHDRPTVTFTRLDQCSDLLDILEISLDQET